MGRFGIAGTPKLASREGFRAALPVALQGGQGRSARPALPAWSGQRQAHGSRLDAVPRPAPGPPTLCPISKPRAGPVLAPCTSSPRRSPTAACPPQPARALGAPSRSEGCWSQGGDLWRRSVCTRCRDRLLPGRGFGFASNWHYAFVATLGGRRGHPDRARIDLERHLTAGSTRGNPLPEGYGCLAMGPAPAGPRRLTQWPLLRPWRPGPGICYPSRRGRP